MSYPRKLHVLVIEDESTGIESYRGFFGELAKEFSVVDPTYLRSFADAKRYIDGDNVVHVVILDLNLPMENRGEPPDGFSLGEQLLELLANREAYPVPAVLVVSGKLNLPHSFKGIQDRLSSDFLYGRLVNKGSPDLYREMQEALARSLHYADVGIHIGDSGKQWFPTLSPREEDLLRRCVLAQSEVLGIDVRWWSAENGRSVSGGPSPTRGPTKVLMGRFLLDQGVGPGLPHFFKFEPSGNAQTVYRDASILAQKLGHIKIAYESKSRERSLIVTQSVTYRGTPVPLDVYLQDDPARVGLHIPQLVAQIVDQLRQLGSQTEVEIPVTDLLFKYLDRDAIKKVLDAAKTTVPPEGGMLGPLEAMDRLRASTDRQWVTRCSCTHGDLNASNVAIDVGIPEQPQAYIFDGAGIHADLDFRDLATLEVTTIVFNSTGIDETFLDSCQALYSDGFAPHIESSASLSPLTRNVFAMVGAIRQHAQTELQQATYAILALDAVLRQLSGLGIQPSPNKAKNPHHVCILANWIAAWVGRVATSKPE